MVLQRSPSLKRAARSDVLPVFKHQACLRDSNVSSYECKMVVLAVLILLETHNVEYDCEENANR